MPRRERNYLKTKKETPNQKIQVASRIDLDLYAFIEKRAKKKEKTVSSQVLFFLKLGIETFKKEEEQKK